MTGIRQEKHTLFKKALILEWILIIYNILEASTSIGFGLLAGSIALVGFGLDSVIEVYAAGILVWRLSHHETLEEENEKEKKALLSVGVTFFILAICMIYESSSKLLRHEMPRASIAGIIIALLSLLIMPFLGFRKRKIANEIQSQALRVDVLETIICAYLSFALLLGLSLNALFGWWWADPVAALAMVYFVVKKGLEAIEEARQSPYFMEQDEEL